MTVNHDVAGSSPAGGATWLRGQAVKTPPFHGGNTGSIPVRVTTPFCRIYGGIAQPVERPPHTRKVTDSSSVVSTITKKSEFVSNRRWIRVYSLFGRFYNCIMKKWLLLSKVRAISLGFYVVL